MYTPTGMVLYPYIYVSRHGTNFVPAYGYFQTNGPMSVLKYYTDPDALQIFTKIAK